MPPRRVALHDPTIGHCSLAATESMMQDAGKRRSEHAGADSDRTSDFDSPPFKGAPAPDPIGYEAADPSLQSPFWDEVFGASGGPA